jgi:hypothetical protein
MTKNVRVENADNSNHPVRVQAQEKNAQGEWVDVGAPQQLDIPTAMTTATIWGNHRIVIEERAADPAP